MMLHCSAYRVNQELGSGSHPNQVEAPARDRARQIGPWLYPRF
jgi:hypothetical protein